MIGRLVEQSNLMTHFRYLAALLPVEMLVY